MASNNSDILIVDEDPIKIKLMTKLLEADGHKVTSTSNSKEAFEKINKLKPDCVISALMMPGVDGLQLCKKIKEAPELKNIRFIMTSIKAYAFDKKRSFNFGADGYIRKPINPAKIAAAPPETISQAGDLEYFNFV